MSDEEPVSAEAIVEDFETKLKQERAAEIAAAQIVVEACGNNVRIDSVVALALEKCNCASLFLEWAVDKFWALQMPKLLIDLDKIYAELKRKRIGEKKLLSFNDADDTVYYLYSKTKKVIVHTGQNFNYIYIWDKDGPGYRNLHVRQFYDIYQQDDDKYEQEELLEFQKKTQTQGYKPAILLAQAFVEMYADDYASVPYPHRYSLNHYKKTNYEVKYGDFRDNGYILSWNEFYQSFGMSKVEGAIRSHHAIKLICECFVPCILTELLPDEESANDTAKNKRKNKLKKRNTE